MFTDPVYSDGMEELSPRQQAILDFIVSTLDQRGVVPTYREIGASLGIGSTNGVSDHIKALVKKGYLERAGDPGSPRCLKLTPRATGKVMDDGVVGVPVLGRIAAGAPLLAEENYEGTVRVDGGLLPAGGNVFALVVRGESMIEDGIQDGDFLFVRQQVNARNGEITVAMVDGSATVKRLYREGARVRLQPANKDMDPIYVDPAARDFSIIGVAVGLYRRISG
jgi:repressor LexA